VGLGVASALNSPAFLERGVRMICADTAAPLSVCVSVILLPSAFLFPHIS
jgi:hypothetical protein